MNIGDIVYYYNPRKDIIDKGKLVGKSLSAPDPKQEKAGIYEAYVICSIMGDDFQNKNVEEAHVHKTKEACQKHRDKVKPIIDKANDEQAKGKARIDKMRIDVIGEPLKVVISDKPKLKVVENGN